MIDSGTLLQGRFLIEDKIGSGGMGAVYRAVDQKFGSLVAIKETFYGDTELAEAFAREARLLNGLHHPIFPHVSDSFTENGGHFLVMEFIEGEDLSEILKRGETLPVNTVLGWALDVLDGLDYLHSQDPPVIHRDIKPNNLKLTSRGKIVLLDFGMAKETTGNTIGAKSVFGYSRRYSPLEQIEGTGTDPRSDIFSLGASVYHLLTGEAPADALARASAIVAGRPDPLVPAHVINPDVPQAVTDILTSALALSPENRLASAREMASSLESAIGSVPYSTENESSVTGAGIAVAGEGFDLGETASPSSSRTRVPVASIATGDTSSIAASRTPYMRGKRPVWLRYAVAVPVVLLCAALLLFGTYSGLLGGGNKPDLAAEPVASAAGEIATEIPQETAKPETVVAAETVEQSPATAHEEAAVVPENNDAETARRNGVERQAAVEVAPEPVRSNQRTEQPRRSDAGESRPRRVVKPAFEQPAVSSIEAIMTGVPNERRRRWEEDQDALTEDELRRRQLRRMRRERRRQQQQEPY